MKVTLAMDGLILLRINMVDPVMMDVMQVIVLLIIRLDLVPVQLRPF